MFWNIYKVLRAAMFQMQLNVYLKLVKIYLESFFTDMYILPNLSVDGKNYLQV